MREKDILHENGDYWICKIGKSYCVMQSGITHSVSVEAYAELCLASARVDYLARTETRLAALRALKGQPSSSPWPSR